MIVITGATGGIGSQLLDLLPEDDVRVVVRDPSRLPADLGPDVEVVRGSHGDPEVLAPALEDADALFWLLPTDRSADSVDAAYSGFTSPVIDAIRESGVRRVVDVTALGRGTEQEQQAGYVTGSLAMDDLLADAGKPFRALACAGFMDNVLRQLVPMREHGVYSDAVPADVRLPYVATRDIAATAAGLLRDDSWVGVGEVPLMGPADHSMTEVVALISQAVGQEVRYQEVSPGDYRDYLTGVGMSGAMAQGVVDMMTAKAAGLDFSAERTPEVAARTPTTFEQWCAEVLVPAWNAI